MSKLTKIKTHLMWSLPFLVIQYLNWRWKGEHLYGFLKHFSWVQLVVFELTLLMIAVWIDYFLTMRHGYKIALK